MLAAGAAWSVTSADAQSFTPSPPSLRTGPRPLSAQQMQAVQSLTAAQKQSYLSRVQPTLANLRSQAASYKHTAAPAWQDVIAHRVPSTAGQSSSAVASANLVFTNINGGSITVGTAAVTAATPAATAQPSLKPPCCSPVQPIPNGDPDGDGLLDSFENNIAEGFKPVYGVSSGERQLCFAIHKSGRAGPSLPRPRFHPG